MRSITNFYRFLFSITLIVSLTAFNAIHCNTIPALLNTNTEWVVSKNYTTSSIASYNNSNKKIFYKKVSSLYDFMFDSFLNYQKSILNTVFIIQNKNTLYIKNDISLRYSYIINTT